MQRCAHGVSQAPWCLGVSRPAHRRRGTPPGASAGGAVASASVGQHTRQGTSRKQNEDRLATVASLPVAGAQSVGYFAVFDGHGGSATSEWLKNNLAGVLTSTFDPARPEKSITEAFLAADSSLLAPQGFLGMGERGVGGPKCGSTGLVALLLPGATPQLLCANCGDARAVLVAPDGSVQQLSIDHVPDDEDERRRIELRNPNPRMPLVRFVGSTWRVGGLLALSRAFGDAYVKKAGDDFEGYGGAYDDYGSGFGVIATPHVAMVPATGAAVLVMASDGLYANEERGGGGGLTNERVAELVSAAPATEPLDALAQRLAAEAVEQGSTDDVTVLVVRLP